MHKRQGFALPSRSPAGKTLCDAREQTDGGHEGRKIAEFGGKQRPCRAAGPRDHRRRLFRCLQPRPLCDRRLVLPDHAARASWCPAPWTRRCGRWRLPRDDGRIVTPRGGGTSQCGQTVNEGIVVDFSKHLNRIISLDVENRTCVVEPGIVLDDLNRQLKKHGLWFPVDVSTASRATIGGMAGNNSCGGRSLRYGTMRDNTLSMDAALADGTLLHFGEVPRDLARVNSPDSGLALFRDMLDLGEREAAEIAEKISKSAAPGRRLQSRRAGAAQCAEQHGASAGRLRRHAGLHHAGRTQALAGASATRCWASAISAASTRRWMPPSIW